MAWDIQIGKFVALVCYVGSSLLNILYVDGKLQLVKQGPAGSLLLVYTNDYIHMG